MAEGKKNAARLGAHIVFLDESGFLLVPLVLRTWAPRGSTPLCQHRYRRDKLSVISCISVSPQRRRLNLYFDFFATNINAALVRDFLRELMRSLRGHIFVLLDNASIHRGDEIKELLRSTRRLHLVPFPSYAPELNPDEGVWSHAKRELANGRPDSIFELGAELYGHFTGLSGNQTLLRGFIKQTGLPLRLP